MAHGHFSSEDAAIEALANALLLNTFVASQQHLAFQRSMVKTGASRPEDMEKTRLLVTENRELRDVLELAGALDRRIDGPIDITSASAAEPMGAAAGRVNDLLNSDADIATLRLRDFLFPQWFLDWPGVSYALATADLYELRTPLAMFGPTKLTHALREPILAYFRGEVPGSDSIFAHDPFAASECPEPSEAEAEIRGGGPRSGEEIAIEKRAQAALRAFAAASSGKRMVKRDFCDALIAISAQMKAGKGLSGRAADQVWRATAPAAWKAGGRPGGDIPLLTADDLRPYLIAELGRRSESRAPVPEPPPDWAELLQPRPWPADGEVPK